MNEMEIKRGPGRHGKCNSFNAKEGKEGHEAES